MFGSRRVRVLLVCLAGLLTIACFWPSQAAVAAERFEGRFFAGEGDVEYLSLLDISRRMFEPDSEFQNMPMLYTPAWNGLVEGPTWGAWWIQNSYGPSYCALPFWHEPWVTFLQNSQDLWFDQMGDGKRIGGQNWQAPDGCLCDAASPGWIYYKQGDGRVDIHDWGMEFTAAGLVLQSEAVLIRRDSAALAHYLPMLERVANFIETRRDPQKNLFLAGPAGNLLAPSYAGCKRPDGSFDKAYLAGLSVTYIAGLDRLVELEKLAGRPEQAALYADRRQRAREGLANVTTEEGYFIKSLDPDGTRHGVYGAAKHGYFEAVVNHDAICFRVADDQQAEKIYQKIAAIPGLRRCDLIITNCPGLDDMYADPVGLWEFGRWVNGGHWSTCEARMIMAYYRLGKYDDARRSMQRMLGYARQFRMDNPLVDFGGNVYQPHEPIHCVYDNWGVPAAMIRGLFEYLYRAEGLMILPHIPPGVTELQQRFPIRFGTKRLWLMTVGSGPVTAVTINGQPWTPPDAAGIWLPYDKTPDEARIQVLLGGAAARPFFEIPQAAPLPPAPPADVLTWAPNQFPVIAANNLPLRIGADSNGQNQFVGCLARPRLFGRALSQQEIAQLKPARPGPLDDDPALVADWPLDGPQDGQFANLTGGLPAKIVGQVEVVDGPGGKAIRLGGEGYLEVANDPRIQLTKGCTLDAWIRPDKLPPGGSRIIDKCQAGTSNGYLLDTCPGHSLRLICERGSLGHDARLPSDCWTHVTATIDGEGSLALYVDGQRVCGRDRGQPPDVAAINDRAARLRAFCQQLAEAGLAGSYEAAHARLAIDYLSTCYERMKLLAEGRLQPLPQPISQYAADKSYFATAAKLADGLDRVLQSYAQSDEAGKKKLFELWTRSASPP